MIRILKFISLISIVIFLTSCDKMADVTNPVSYDQNGISFLYPKNWEITDDEKLEDVRYLILESPGDAIFIIQIYSQQDAVSITEYAEWFSEEAIKETPVLERTVGVFTNIEAVVGGMKIRGLKLDFAVNVFKITVPHVSEFYRIENKKNVAFLISQAAVEDLPDEVEGFKLILKSFKINNET